MREKGIAGNQDFFPYPTMFSTLIITHLFASQQAAFKSEEIFTL